MGFFLRAVLAVLVAFGISVYFSQEQDIDELGLAGSRVVVCGASTGIGEQTALVYAGAGARVSPHLAFMFLPVGGAMHILFYLFLLCICLFAAVVVVVVFYLIF